MRNVNVSWPRRPPRGFTLIELVVAIVVLAILTSVALPVFFDSIRKSRRTEGFAALNAVQQAQERWRANNPSYATDLTSAAPTGLGFQTSTPTGYYTIGIANVTATGYDVTATAVSGTSQAKDTDCALLGVRMAGGNVLYAGAGASGTLSFATNHKCWSR